MSRDPFESVESPYRPRLHRGLKRLARPLITELERAFDEFEEPLGRIERSVAELMLGHGLPTGVSPGSHIAPGVPRVRPVLVLLATRAAGGDQDAEEAAFSAELLHKAVVLHDAALGRQDGRRRRITRRLLGGAAHWLGGHHLGLRALEVVRASRPELLGEVLDTMREITEGHALAERLRDADPDLEDWRDYAELHIGAVYAFSCRAGARLAGAPREIGSALGRYGRHMGIAWHALEDQWLITVSAEELPKILAHRTASGRPVLPLIVALEEDPEVDALVDRVLADGDVAAARELQRRLVCTEGLFETRKTMVEHSLAARRALRVLRPGPHRDALDRLAYSLAASGARIAEENE
ncbi:MAG TPA: polyprenyl synthetase family protein [Myxococcota bacterium]|nr:polyprenyl synthetase family protein [Myxococcota bacterium]